MTKPRIALIGTGGILGSHLAALNALKDRVQLVAAVDINAERVRTVCADNHIPHGYTSTTEMLAAEKPDLVHILTPPATHKPLIVESLEAGAWVYCEKPLCA